MAMEHDSDHGEDVLANGDVLEERVEMVDVDDDETCSTDEMRERLGL